MDLANLQIKNFEDYTIKEVGNNRLDASSLLNLIVVTDLDKKKLTDLINQHDTGLIPLLLAKIQLLLNYKHCLTRTEPILQ